MFDSTSSHQRLQERILNLTVALYRVTDYFPKAEILRNHLRAKANEIFERLMEYGSASEGDSEVNVIIHKIKTIKGYLEIAGTLNYVRSLNFVILEKEYNFIEEFLMQEKMKLIKHPISEDIKRIEREGALDSFMKEDSLPKIPQENFDTTLLTELTHDTLDTIDTAEVVKETGKTHRMFYERKGEEVNDRQKVLITHLKQLGSAKISDFYASFHDISSKTIQRDLQSLVDMRILKKEGEKRWTVYSLIPDTR